MSRAMYLSDVLLGAFEGFHLSLFPRSICGSQSLAPEAWCSPYSFVADVCLADEIVGVPVPACRGNIAFANTISNTSCIDKTKQRYFVHNLQRQLFVKLWLVLCAEQARDHSPPIPSKRENHVPGLLQESSQIFLRCLRRE